MPRAQLCASARGQCGAKLSQPLVSADAGSMQHRTGEAWGWDAGPLTPENERRRLLGMGPYLGERVWKLWAQCARYKPGPRNQREHAALLKLEGVQAREVLEKEGTACCSIPAWRINPVSRGAWRVIGQGVTESQPRLKCLSTCWRGNGFCLGKRCAG